VELVASVGNDSIGNFLISELARIGLSTQNVSLDKSFPSSLVLVGRSMGTPDFIAYRMADIRIMPVSKSLLKNSSIVHTSAFALSKEPARTHILEAMKYATLLGNEISCDWNFATEIWATDSGQEVFKDLCEMKPLLKLSLDDFRRFTGNSEATAEMAMNFLDKFNTKLTCLTCGSEGVWYTNEENNWVNLPAQKVEVKDTTGAGDAFWAGFLSSYIEENTISQSVERGIKIASQKIQKLGPLYV
jgi:fructokinase